MLSKVLYQWRGFASGSVNRRILYAMSVIMAATFAVKVAAVIKDMVVAGTFGLADELDAFLIALVIPFFAIGVLAQSFNGSFMPVYIRVREQEGDPAARRLFAHIIVANFLVLLVCTGLLAAVGMPLLNLLASEFSAEKRALAYRLYLMLLPLIVIEGQLSLWGSVLNAGEKFLLVAVSPVVRPLIIIGVLLFFGLNGVSIEALAWATVFGCLAELGAVAYALIRRGLLPIPRWNLDVEAARDVAKQYLPLAMSAVIMGSSSVIDQAMASWLGSGSVAALNYGNKIPAFVSGIGATALGTAVLPHFSRLVAVGDYVALRHTMSTYTRWVLAISVPVTLGFIAGSEWLVHTLFERGAFGPDDTLVVARIQQMYLIQVPFSVLGILAVRVLVAMSKNHLLTLMSVINLIVNVVGNVIFMRWFGVSGIALSTSVVYVVSMTMILILVGKNLRSLERAKEQS
jgi:putative peptidoglycan lipid II flippase